MPSETARISSKLVTAVGFSILERTAARPPINALASSTSAARCTNDRAIQSTPSWQTNSRSARSLSDKAAKGSTTSGTLTPLRLEIAPPAVTIQSAKSSPHVSTFRRILPSFTSRVVPSSSALKISGCGKQTRALVPAVSSRSNRNFCPSTSSSSSLAKTPTRSFGPCKSAKIAIGLSSSRSISRMILCRSRISS